MTLWLSFESMQKNHSSQGENNTTRGAPIEFQSPFAKFLYAIITLKAQTYKLHQASLSLHAWTVCKVYSLKTKDAFKREIDFKTPTDAPTDLMVVEFGQNCNAKEKIISY